VRVLLISDVAATGFGRVGRELGTRLLAMGHDIRIIGINWQGIDGEMSAALGAGSIGEQADRVEKRLAELRADPLTDLIMPAGAAGDGMGHNLTAPAIRGDLWPGWTPEGIIIVAATNRPDVLDTALLRPGRFDRRVTLDMPDMNDREAILKIHSKGKPLAKDVNLRVVAVRTPGFAGAELSNLMNEAALFAARKNKKEVTQEHILDSIEKVLLGPARKSRVITDHEKEVTAYHEAGHALVAAALKESDRRLELARETACCSAWTVIPSAEG